MEIKANLKYAKTHEWVDVTGGTAKIGISDFAQSELGDLVFVELPEVGTEVACGKAFANVESVKAVSEIYSPVCGKVIAVNEELMDSPELINEKPYDAWFVEVEVKCVSDKLLDADGYATITK
jgi:glycine cleavage system H protein